MADSIRAPISAEDEAAVEAVRQKFGDAAAAQLWADLYKQRHVPPPGGRLLSTFPRWIVVLIAIWIGLLETADKLPKLLLTVPQYRATLAQYHAQEMQPELVTAQLQKAQLDAQASAYQPETAKMQLDKTRHEAKAASFQPALTAAQAFKAEIDSEASGQIMGDFSSGNRIGVMFDLLDPDHPHLVAKGVVTPDVTGLLMDVLKANPHALDAATKKTSPTASPAPDPAPSPSSAPAEPASAPAPHSDPPPADSSSPPTPSAPAPSTPSLRQPTMFNCSKAFLPVDYVICASPELLDAEARLEDAYNHARGVIGDTVKTEQREWIKSYGVQCGLPNSGRPSQNEIDRATACVHDALRSRISRLNSEAPETP